jgi:hypothetical protein
MSFALPQSVDSSSVLIDVDITLTSAKNIVTFQNEGQTLVVESSDWSNLLKELRSNQRLVSFSRLRRLGQLLSGLGLVLEVRQSGQTLARLGHRVDNQFFTLLGFPKMECRSLRLIWSLMRA